MGRLTTRLADLEKRQPKPRPMLGAIEEHCIGGWGKVRGGHGVQNTKSAPSALRRFLLLCAE